MSTRAQTRVGGLVRFLLVAVVAVVVVMAGLAYVPGLIGDKVRDGLSSLNPFEEERIDRSGPSVLVSLRELSEFKAASGHYEQVVDLEDDSNLPGFLSGQRVLYVAKGDVDVLVDFGDLDEDRVEVSEDGTSATITVPTPTIDEPDLDLEDSYFAESDGGLFSGDTSDLEREAQLEAVARIQTASTDDGQLVDLAKESTTSTLRGLLTALGFTDVTITFDDEAPPDDEPSVDD